MEKKSKNRKVHILFGIVLLYVVLCQSCMTFRYTTKQTRAYFAGMKTGYRDSTLAFGDRHIHYVQSGDAHKPTLYFIHGSPGSWNAFRDYLTDSLLLTKYRMVAFDRPGFGTSDFGDVEHLNTQASRLTHAIQKLDNGKPCVLIGHSMGGPVILKIASLHPEKYKELVVLAGSVDPFAENPEKWRPVIASVPLRYLIPGAMRMSNDELWLLKDDLFRLKPVLKNITSDVLIFHGTEDPLVPYRNVAYMKRELENARTLKVISIPKANHFIPWEHFDEIRNALYGIPL